MSKYAFIDEVRPRAWRSLDNYPLSLDQVNWIVERAEELESPTVRFQQGLGQARAEFRKTHKIVLDQWVRVEGEAAA